MDLRRLVSCLPVLIVLSACSPVTPEATERGDVLPASPVKGRPVLGGVDLNAPINALGVEPFWGLEIRQAGLRMAGLDRADLFAPNPGPVLQGDVAVWESTTDVGAPLKVVLKAETCHDGLSARDYPLTASVDFAGEVVHGCAGASSFVVQSAWRRP